MPRKTRSDSLQAQQDRLAVQNSPRAEVPWHLVPQSEHLNEVGRTTVARLWHSLDNPNALEAELVGSLGICAMELDQLLRLRPEEYEFDASWLRAVDAIQNRQSGLARTLRARSDRSRQFHPLGDVAHAPELTDGEASAPEWLRQVIDGG